MPSNASTMKAVLVPTRLLPPDPKLWSTLFGISCNTPPVQSKLETTPCAAY